MLALQFGVPGGPELLVILLILFMLAIPVAVAVLLVGVLRKRRGLGDQVEALERRVEELEEELESRE